MSATVQTAASPTGAALPTASACYDLVSAPLVTWDQASVLFQRLPLPQDLLNLGARRAGKLWTDYSQRLSEAALLACHPDMAPEGQTAEERLGPHHGELSLVLREVLQLPMTDVSAWRDLAIRVVGEAWMAHRDAALMDASLSDVAAPRLRSRL